MTVKNMTRYFVNPRVQNVDHIRGIDTEKETSTLKIPVHITNATELVLQMGNRAIAALLGLYMHKLAARSRMDSFLPISHQTPSKGNMFDLKNSVRRLKTICNIWDKTEKLLILFSTPNLLSCLKQPNPHHSHATFHILLRKFEQM